MGLQTVVLQYNSPNQPLGIQIKPQGSKSSPGNPNQALEVQIEPQGSKASPGGPNQAPGGPNQALGHKTGLQGCRPIKNTILDGSLDQVRFWGIWGELCRVPVWVTGVELCRVPVWVLLKYVQVRTDTPDTYSYCQKRADTPDTCRHALICSGTQRYARCVQIRQIQTDMLDTCRYVMIRQIRADAPDTCR